MRRWVLSLLVACSVPAPRDPEPVDAIPPDLGAQIEGVVSNPLGEAIPGAYVVTEPHGYEAVTGSDGRFSLRRLNPETLDLVVSAPGFATARWTDVSAAVELTEDVLVVLEPAVARTGRVSVEVMGPDGLPLEGALVTDGLGQEVSTDSLGMASLVDLGGLGVDVEIADAAGSLWPRLHRGLEVPLAGNVQLSTQLSGRPSADAVDVGSAVCMLCHSTQGVDHGASRHAQALTEGLPDPLPAEFVASPVVNLGAASATLADNLGVYEVRLTAFGGSQRTFEVAGVLGASDSGSVPYTLLGDQAYPLPVAWTAAQSEFAAWPEAQASWVPFEVDRWFDPAGQFVFAVGASPLPSRSAEAECFSCHATGFDLAVRPDGGVDMSATFGSGTRWGEAGVGCERCHGAGSAHVDASGATKPSEITRPDLLDTDRANEVCSQCHGAHTALSFGLPYPYSASLGSFEPGASMADYGTTDATSWPSGAADRPNAQADELERSAHGPGGAYTLRCADCHESHGGSLPTALRQDADDNTLCASCHLSWTFDGDQDLLEDHTEHFGYDPAGPSQMGRCVGCHMPATSARLSWGSSSGAGDLSSHRFLALAPQETLDVFDSLGQSVLAPGAFPTHACAACHAWGSWREAELGTVFGGPTGDPSLRATHETFQTAFQAKFP